MILYINGDSHTAGAEAVNTHAFAEDDPELTYLGRLPHPANLAVTWGKLLGETFKAGFHCDAESASSNARILRTTRQRLEQFKNYDNILVIIQWSTWEREEWLHNGIYYQVGASGLDHVPTELQEKYKQYIVDLDWNQKIEQAHSEIWELHKELESQNIKHVFFNGNNNFSTVREHLDWGNNYIDPYNPSKTFDAIIRSAGIDTVAPNSWHFGKDGHSFFHRFMLQYIIDNKFT